MEPTTDLLWISLVALAVLGGAGLLTFVTASAGTSWPSPGPRGDGRPPPRRPGPVRLPWSRQRRPAPAGGGFRRPGAPEGGPACAVEPELVAAWRAGSGRACPVRLLVAVALALGMLAIAAATPRRPAARVSDAEPPSTGPAAANRALGVGFTFEPAEAVPGQPVRIHLSPPFPVEVRLDGRTLPAAIRNGGRVLVVRVPGDAQPGNRRLELVAGTRHAAAPVPLRIVGSHQAGSRTPGGGVRTAGAPRPGPAPPGSGGA